LTGFRTEAAKFTATSIQQQTPTLARTRANDRYVTGTLVAFR
jgi:hypothetical protein